VKRHGSATVSSGSSSGGSETNESAQAISREEVASVLAQKQKERLVDWIVKLLVDDVRKIVSL
jgi:hypothetical protein